MSGREEISEERVGALLEKLDREARESGYHLNPDTGFTRGLIRGLLVNQERVGYLSCPCRMPSGDKTSDLDIICPCDYRDPDLTEYGTCYCALYVNEEILRGEREVASIPERRPPEGRRPVAEGGAASVAADGGELPVWRCRVCGYLCAREEPPERCPICKVSSERFERFPLQRQHA
jgi:ferredoxin-thioredoxin reductase catalytic subunit/rubredoxin